jgi:hypothetical protein
VRDFAFWEPGTVRVCAVCQREYEDVDPPGPWFRHKPSHRRRIPIYGAVAGLPVGYFVFERL